MANTDMTGTESRAAVKGHPLHPMLVPFPIAALVGALLTDFAYLGTDDPFWARMSIWLLGAGVIMGGVAGVVGYLDFSKIPRARQQAVGWAHAVGNSIVLLLALINWALRVGDPIDGLVPWGTVLSLVCVVGLMFTGWFGGELVYRHRIGVTASSDRDPPGPRERS